MSERDRLLRESWDSIRPGLEVKLKNQKTYTVTLYNLQLITNLLFDYACRRGDIEIMEELAKLYLIPLNHLQERDDYWFYTGETGNGHKGYELLPLETSSRMWVKEITKGGGTISLETTLHSSQFLYLMAHALHCFVSLPESDRRPNIRLFIEKYPGVLLEHYNRWIFDSNGSTGASDSLGVFQVMGWGCFNGRFNHRQFLEHKWKRQLGNAKSYCSGVRDEDMWIFCGAVELLAAGKKSTDLFVMEPDREAEYKEYFGIACDLIESRLEETFLENFDGVPVRGLNVDPGAWKDHRDLRHAGYEEHDENVFPGETPDSRTSVIHTHSPVPETISWDISHARRFVQVFETLYRNRSITGKPFPGRDVLTKLSNQMAYSVFNRDFERPLFSNYFDGSNGWYRVNYANRPGFGYAPSDYSVEWIAGGFASWQCYQPDLKRVNDAIWDMINSNDSEIRQFRTDRYEHSFYWEGKRKKRPCLDHKKFHHILDFIAAYDLPPIPLELPEISLERSGFNFGAQAGSDRTCSETVSITNSGEGNFFWKAQSDSGWLTVSPSSGTGDGEIKITVAPRILTAGKHRGIVEVQAEEAANTPQIITVIVTVYQPGEDTKLAGSFDTPGDNTEVSGSIGVTGWALDLIGVESVKLYRKARRRNKLFYIGDAVFSEGTRPDVQKLHPNYSDSHRAGWGYMLLTNTLPNRGNGPFELHIKAKSISGQEKTIGIKTIRCNNTQAKKPFGSIDWPKAGQTVSGVYRIQGWALTPPPNKIPEDGKTINVFVDNKWVGHANYNIFRQDIAGLFKKCLNSRGALTFFDLDTTALSNGLHQLAWSVKDNAGNMEGIGSRFFKVRNE
ncbi:MAG: BACON domain-containing protein [bacterium]|nr:BACON domain-containing protein [bacterium]